MSTLNISLPKPLRDFVDEQVAKGGYATASEYVRELIRQRQKEAARKWLEDEMLRGLRSGPAKVMTDRDWADIRRRVQGRVVRRRRA